MESVGVKMDVGWAFMPTIGHPEIHKSLVRPRVDIYVHQSSHKITVMPNGGHECPPYGIWWKFVFLSCKQILRLDLHGRT